MGYWLNDGAEVAEVAEVAEAAEAAEAAKGAEGAEGAEFCAQAQWGVQVRSAAMATKLVLGCMRL